MLIEKAQPNKDKSFIQEAGHTGDGDTQVIGTSS